MKHQLRPLMGQYLWHKTARPSSQKGLVPACSHECGRHRPVNAGIQKEAVLCTGLEMLCAVQKVTTESTAQIHVMMCAGLQVPPQKEKATCPNTQRVTVKEKGSDKPTGRSASIRRRLNKCGPPFGGHGQSHFLFFVLCQSSLNRFCVDIWKDNIWIYLHLCWMVTSEEWTIGI